MTMITTFLRDDYFDENTLLRFNYTDPEVNDMEHTHEFDELVVVDKGYAVQVFNGELFFLQEGDVFLVKEGDRHFYNELGTLKLMNLHINTHYQFRHLQHIKSILDQIYVKNTTNFVWLMPKDKEFCIELIRKIDKLDKQQNEASLFQAEALFMQIISTILQGKHSIQNNSTQYKVRNLLIYLQRHYADQIDWQKLSDDFYLTNKTMTRKMKELTGMTPINYLNRLRVLAAREKIRHSDDSITDIAGLCGFNNSDYFAKCYKKNFGISPSDERKQFG